MNHVKKKSIKIGHCESCTIVRNVKIVDENTANDDVITVQDIMNGKVLMVPRADIKKFSYKKEDCYFIAQQQPYSRMH